MLNLSDRVQKIIDKFRDDIEVEVEKCNITGLVSIDDTFTVFVFYKYNPRSEHRITKESPVLRYDSIQGVNGMLKHLLGFENNDIVLELTGVGARYVKSGIKQRLIYTLTKLKNVESVTLELDKTEEIKIKKQPIKEVIKPIKQVKKKEVKYGKSTINCS